MSRRLYSQYQPAPGDLSWLLDLQQEVAAVNDRGRIVPAGQIHLTIIHFGILDEVFEQIRAEAPDLEYDTYRRQVAAFTAAAERALLPEIRLTATGLELFGFAHNTLVLTLEATPEIERVHAQSLSALRSFFKGCGVTDPQAFMAGNQNFQFALSISPHVTLLKHAPVLPEIVIEPKILQLQAMPLLYD